MAPLTGVLEELTERGERTAAPGVENLFDNTIGTETFLNGQTSEQRWVIADPEGGVSGHRVPSRNPG